jgi:hypothetical protein
MNFLDVHSVFVERTNDRPPTRRAEVDGQIRRTVSHGHRHSETGGTRDDRVTPGLGHLSAILTFPKCVDGIDRRTRATPGLCHQWAHVGLERLLERAFRHEDVPALLILLERLAVDERRLGVRNLKLIDCLQHRLDRIFQIVTRSIMYAESIRQRFTLGHRLMEDQK